jgi:hypothetical protein
MGANNKCCCTCAEMFQDFEEGDDVTVGFVAGGGQSSTVTGELTTLGDNSVVITQQGVGTPTRVCCAYIIFVEPAPGGGQPT